MTFSDDQPTGTLRALRAGQPPPDIAWRPAASPGVQVGLLLLVGLAVLTVLGIWLATSQAGVLRILALLIALVAGGAAGVVGVLLRALLALRYQVSARGLEMEWLGRRTRIPWADIQDVEWQGETRQGIPAAPRAQQRWEPWWPGYAVRYAKRDGLSDVTLATLEPGRRVVLLHARGTLVISPERPVRFLAEVALRVALALEEGTSDAAAVRDVPYTPASDRAPTNAETVSSTAPPRGLEPERSVVSASTADTPHRTRVDAAAPLQRAKPVLAGRSADAASGVWQQLVHGFTALGQERVGSILLSVLGGLPILLGMVLYSRLDVLPERIPIHWDADGQPDRYGSERMLWLLPTGAIIAAVVSIIVASWMLLRDRVASLALLWFAVLVQIALAIALLRLT